jgi:hypothetical protein
MLQQAEAAAEMVAAAGLVVFLQGWQLGQEVHMQQEQQSIGDSAVLISAGQFDEAAAVLIVPVGCCRQQCGTWHLHIRARATVVGAGDRMLSPSVLICTVCMAGRLSMHMPISHTVRAVVLPALPTNTSTCEPAVYCFRFLSG